MSDLQKDRFLNLLRKMVTRIERLERYASSGRWLSYTPVLGALTTAPTLGTGSSVSGKYVTHGLWTCAMGEFQFGTAGVSAGSGGYTISLPINPDNPTGMTSPLVFGTVRGSQQIARGGTIFSTSNLTISSNVILAAYTAAWPVGAETNVGSGSPWVWAANYRLQFAVMYESAE